MNKLKEKIYKLIQKQHKCSAKDCAGCTRFTNEILALFPEDYEDLWNKIEAIRKLSDGECNELEEKIAEIIAEACMHEVRSVECAEKHDRKCDNPVDPINVYDYAKQILALTKEVDCPECGGWGRIILEAGIPNKYKDCPNPKCHKGKITTSLKELIKEDAK